MARRRRSRPHDRPEHFYEPPTPLRPHHQPVRAIVPQRQSTHSLHTKKRALTSSGSLAQALAAQRAHKPRSANRRHTHFGLRPYNDLRRLKYILQPHKALWVCVKRKMRKEVLHALKLTGKGSGAKKHRYNDESLIKCPK